MRQIEGFHAHVYYDETTYEQAKDLCLNAEAQLPVTVGYMHKRAVGPHPCWSCQLTCSAQTIGQVISWLCLNRDGLTVFIHPVTNNHLEDHSNYAIWMGEVKSLKLSIFMDE